ncbi:30S ribosomal protein S14 [Rickettsiaceae bacterium]|jgi:small subunit ribosomal protein S14|nr:30S ribosomal protein S14 [Rickettsiaceae bacterium]
MAKSGSVQRNDKRKRLVASFKSKRDELSKEIHKKDLPLEERFALVVKLAKLPRNSASNRVRNRCALTGRPRGYHRKMGLSRNMLRALAAEGLLPGVVKSSW